MNNTQREFEAWLQSQGMTFTWDSERGFYREYPAYLAYAAWQALTTAHEGKVRELRESLRWIRDLPDEDSTPTENMLIQSVRNALAEYEKEQEHE